MKWLHFFTIITFVALLAGCATSTDLSGLYKGQSESKIFYDGQKLMLAGNYSEAIKHFNVLDARYPFGRYSRQSQLDSIYSYYKKQDYILALAAADRYIRLYPQGPNVDYAYYMRGLMKFYGSQAFFEKYFPADFAKRDVKPLQQAYADFMVLVKYFPHSKYAADARVRLIYIRDTLARHQLQVAQFYYKSKAYVAAANRANEVVRHYQRTPSVPDALAVMVKSYRKLGLMKDANESLRVLQLNYPRSKALQSVQSYAS
jgi:outer membrane protein assembly factor BamD